MSKDKIKYVCSNCGYESLRWIGKCPQCDSWNTFTEEFVESKKNTRAKDNGKSEIVKLSALREKQEERIKTNIAEFDRVLGGGLMPGSVILLGGFEARSGSIQRISCADRGPGQTILQTQTGLRRLPFAG